MTLKMANSALATLLGVLAIFSLFVGVIDVDWRSIFSGSELHLMLVSRIPRTLSTIITGATLAICGTIIQQLVRNRFVEPMTAGSGQGAMLGVLIAIFMFPQAPMIFQIGLAASVAMLANAGLMLLVTKLPPTQPIYVALVGLVYGGIIGAGVTFFAYQYDFLQYLSIWMTGEFSGILLGRYETLWIAAIVAGFAYWTADQFSIAGMGKDTSIGLGLNYRLVVILGLVIISLVTALCVVTVGMLPFVGLVIPNIVSRYFGDNLRKTLPITALLGGILVLVCDILGRILRFPFEIPAGTLLGISGAAIFLVLLYRRGRYAN